MLEKFLHGVVGAEVWEKEEDCSHRSHEGCFASAAMTLLE